MKRKLLTILVLTAAQGGAWASNGMNMIGHGSRSIAMGGTGEALLTGTDALMVNPAGLARLKGNEFNVALSFNDPDIRHFDNLSNNAKESKDRPLIPYLAIATQQSDFVIGAAVSIQGGLGAEYENLISPFSARKQAGQLPDMADTIPVTDTLASEIAHIRFTPTIAKTFGKHWSLGATLNISFVEAELRMFPNTSVAVDGNGSGRVGDSPNDVIFSGMNVENVSDWGASVSVGLQYQTENLTLGVSYTSETSVDLDGGNAVINMTALGAGMVTYDATLTGINWPQEVGAGFAYQVTGNWLLSSDITWINWSRALDDISISLSEASHPGVPQQNNVEMAMDWDNQVVFEIGTEYWLSDNFALRAGYNYGEAPLNTDNLRPQFPVIAESHYTAGIEYQVDGWGLALSVEYVPSETATNNNSDPTINLFGPGSTEKLSQTTWVLGIKKAW